MNDVVYDDEIRLIVRKFRRTSQNCREGGNNPVSLLVLVYCATVYMTSNTKWWQNKRLFSMGEGSGGMGCK